MNEHDGLELEALAREWKVETLELRDRVANAIEEAPLLEQILLELRSIRGEMSQLRHENEVLHTELVRLRSELGVRRNVRISPFSASESLARLS